jgi:glucose-1-phosphate cytidylyltransferase
MSFKAVILAGGYGTRISEESATRPKPMVEIGGRPILWHIMKIFSHWGVNDFVVCLGYKGHMIKSYFADYFLHTSDVTIDLAENRIDVHEKHAEPWKVTLVDTGQDTLTGGRLKRVGQYVRDEELFFMTYGDGVADIDLAELAAHHRREGKKATLTSVQSPPRWGSLEFDGRAIHGFREKPVGVGGWINGGFMILTPPALDLITGDESSFEAQALPLLAAENQLAGYPHRGFWQAMDTLRDKNQLEALWQSREAPWAVWREEEPAEEPTALASHQTSNLTRQAG